jgi:FtsH ternary system domain X7
MPTLLFANLDALRLALVGGAASAELSGSTARAAIDPQGRVWLQTEAAFSRDNSAALGRLGVSILGGGADVELSPVSNWFEVFPLSPMTAATRPNGPVLLAAPVSQLGQTAAEIRRLSPESRIQYRFSDSGDDVLLHVDRCPIFSLSSGGERTAFFEQAPRVWVEAGFEHPLAQLIQPPDGQLAIIRAPGRWSWFSDDPFEPEVEKFQLVESRPRFVDAGGLDTMSLPLRLVEGGPHEAAELWLLREQPLEQLRDLARQSGQAFLERFRWALVEADCQPLVLLWAKPTAGGLPVPAVTGQGYRSFAKLPNLFLPCGYRLSPHLRRDVLRRLCGDEPRELTLLTPLSDGAFATSGIAESAFEPLEKCVDFVLESPPQPLTLAQTAAAIDWEPFAVEAPPPKPATFPPIKLPSRRKKPRVAAKPGLLKRIRNWLRRPVRINKPKKDVEASLRRGLPDRAMPPAPETTGRLTDLLARRSKLEARFLKAMHSPNVVERVALLPELAALNAQLGHLTDSAACWISALWQHPAPPRYWLWGWLQAEKKLSRSPIDENNLETLFEMTPSPATIRTLAAAVYWLANQDPPSQALVEAAGTIRTLLEAHERWLPLRAAWMAHHALTKTAGGDRLALARTRDRLVERLFHHGLSIELDLPSFMRFAGRTAGERFPPVRDWLPRLRDSIHRWIDGHVRGRPANYCRAGLDGFPDADGSATKSLADLMLAWGLARLGEATAAQHLAQPAHQALTRLEDPVLEFLGLAFEARIGLALDGKPAAGPLPADLLDRLERFTPTTDDDRPLLVRYRIDSLRQHSRILEPTEPVNAFRVAAALPFEPEWLGTMEKPDSVGPAMARLLSSREAATRAEEMLATALALAPRLGETFARQFLIRFGPVSERVGNPLPRLLLNGKALAVAALFDLSDVARDLVERLQKMFAAEPSRLPTLAARFIPSVPSHRRVAPDDLHRLEELPGHCLRAVRRLGEPVNLGPLRLQMVGWVLQGEPLSQLRRVQPNTWLPALRALLHVLGGHYDDRNDEQAALVLDAARQVLLYSDVPENEKGPLASAYVAALGQAPIRVAQGRIEEMFRDLTGPYDIRETNSHFALGPLRLIDAVVRAVVADDFVLGPTVRRWLDDDEFQVRQRMQADLEAICHYRPGPPE